VSALTSQSEPEELTLLQRQLASGAPQARASALDAFRLAAEEFAALFRHTLLG
jgi:hypothetical protein